MLHADAVQVLAGAVAIPDAHALLLQHTRISASADEPQQLLCYTCPPNAHLLCAMSCHQHSNVRSQLMRTSYKPSLPLLHSLRKTTCKQQSSDAWSGPHLARMSFLWSAGESCAAD